jgi:hypothetical protein
MAGLVTLANSVFSNESQSPIFEFPGSNPEPESGWKVVGRVAASGSSACLSASRDFDFAG